MLATIKIPKVLNLIWLVLLSLFPIVLWLLPSNFFDKGGVQVCLSMIFFKKECVGCGLTRAVMHLHHFEFADAAYFNPLVFIIYPLLVFLWYKWVRVSVSKAMVTH